MTPQGATELDYQERQRAEIEELRVENQQLRDDLAEARGQNGQAAHRKSTGWASGAQTQDPDPRPLV